MGLFDLLKRKPKKKVETKNTNQFILNLPKDKKKPLHLKTVADQLDYIKDNCEAIHESDRQAEDAKTEYQAVTSYLTDMQKIEMIPEEQKGRIIDAAKQIVILTKEREQFQKKGSSLLSEQQFHIFEQNEIQIPKELPKLKENEQLRADIEQDREHLEEERLDLEEEQEDIISRQSFLKVIAIIISMMVVFLFSLFMMLANKTGGNYMIPFSLTVLMGAGATVYIITEARKNETALQILKQKQKRLISLFNKITIKSVNNLNYLEYTYHKYMVGSFQEFKAQWDEYRRIKEQASKYQKNTDNLEYYNTELIHQLKKHAIKDSEIWILQASAILDQKEREELLHRLNMRRQKLRERIDLNINQKKVALTEISDVINKYPECRVEAYQILKRYRIELQDTDLSFRQ